MLLALARFPFAATEICAGTGRGPHEVARRTRVQRNLFGELRPPFGLRAWQRCASCAASEDLVDRATRGRVTPRNRAFHERGIGDPKAGDGVIRQLPQRRTDGEHRAAESP